MMQSIHNYFSFYLSFHTFRPLQCGLSIGWSSMGNWCSLLHRLWCGYLLWDLEHVLFFLLLWSWRSHCCFSLVSLLLFCLCGFFFLFLFFSAFLICVCPEVPHLWFIALCPVVGLLEAAGTGCAQHGAALTASYRNHPAKPQWQLLATYAQYKILYPNSLLKYFFKSMFLNAHSINQKPNCK